MSTKVDPSKVLLERSVSALKNWKCSTCGAGAKEVASIDLYLLRNDRIIEHIRCHCGFDEHTARLHMRVNFEKVDTE